MPPRSQWGTPAVIAKGIYDPAMQDIVPISGEIYFDPVTQNIKVGDGKTKLKDLPFIGTIAKDDTTVNDDYEVPDNVLRFIERYIDLIETNQFDKLYDIMETYMGRSFMFDVKVTKALLRAGIDPREHMNNVPSHLKNLS